MCKCGNWELEDDIIETNAHGRMCEDCANNL